MMCGMRIEGLHGEQISNVYLWLTRAEAKELADSLAILLQAEDPSRHEHVSASDYQTEITVVIEKG
jgi:hypothetical protein